MQALIPSSLILFINIGYIHMLLTRKRSIKYASFVFIVNYLFFIFGVLFCYIFLKNTIFYQYLLYSLSFSFIIYISLVFEESMSKKIFTLFTIWVFSSAILIICFHIISLFHIKDFNLYRAYLGALRAFIELALMPVMYLYYRPPYKEMLKVVSNKVINIIAVYASLIFLFLINYYEFLSYKLMDFNEIFNSLLFISIIILSYAIIFIAIWNVNKNLELEYKIKIIDTQIQLQKQNYKNLNKSLENYYAFKHDVRHQLLTMKLMMDTKNYIAASTYMNEVTENETNKNVIILCKNFTADTILKHYMDCAALHNIDFDVNVDIPQDINIDNLDLSVVIGNCVENAIEACDNIMDESKKYINIKTQIKGSNLVIKIKNSFNGLVIKKDNIIKTSKSGEGHGIGLSNVRNISEKYNGFFDVKYTDSEFEVSIIMNYNEISK